MGLFEIIRGVRGGGAGAFILGVINVLIGYLLLGRPMAARPGGPVHLWNPPAHRGGRAPDLGVPGPGLRPPPRPLTRAGPDHPRAGHSSSRERCDDEDDHHLPRSRRVLTEREHSVPLDHARPDGPKITVFTREVAAPDGAARPYLVFLQGGPGIEATRPTSPPSGWMKRALEDYRVLLLDQRGTGPIDAGRRRDPRREPRRSRPTT